MTHKPKVIVDPHFRTMNMIFSDLDRSRLYDLVDVVWGRDEPMPYDEFMALLPDAEVVICSDWKHGNDALREAKSLRSIFTVSGGFPLELDYDYCYQQKIRVLSVAPAFARQVAEMALGMALATCREIALGDRLMRSGDEVYLYRGNANTFMLFDQPVGFVGYGSLARALHPLLMPFNVDISVYDPWLGDGYLRRQGVNPVSLEELMKTSRFVFVLAVPSSENVAMISRKYFEMLPHDAVFVLMSRAHVVDFEAMTELTAAGRFRVATDVFPTEPLAPDHPIRQVETAVMSAHRAGSVREGLWEIGQMVVDDLEVVLQGLPPRRMQLAEPELSMRYASNNAKEPKK